MHPQAIPEVKNVILNSNVQKTRKAINKILKCDKRITRENLIRNL
jgi:phosphoenolpyruvate-protein kinase (PTS system EI component)